MITENRSKYASAYTLQDLIAKRYGSTPVFMSIDAGSRLELSFKLRNTQGYIELFEINDKLYSVSASEADSGWGPLLYDWAIEEATLRGHYLCADRFHSISFAARKVWDYYLHHRKDVHCKQINMLENLDTFHEVPYSNLQRVLEVYGKYNIPKDIWGRYRVLFEKAFQEGSIDHAAHSALILLQENHLEEYQKINLFFKEAGVNYMYQKESDIIDQIDIFETKNLLERVRR